MLLVQLVGIWWLIDGTTTIIYMFVDRTGWGWKLFWNCRPYRRRLDFGLPIYAAITLPRIFLLIIGIWGLFRGTEMLFVSLRARAWGSVVLGAIVLVLGVDPHCELRRGRLGNKPDLDGRLVRLSRRLRRDLSRVPRA